MFTNQGTSHGACRFAAAAILWLGILGCAGAPTPPAEPPAAAPPTSVAPAAIAPSAEQAPLEALKALLADRRAKPVLLGAGGLLAAILLGLGLAKVLRGDVPEARPADSGNDRRA